MLIDGYPTEDVFARVSGVTGQTDPVFIDGTLYQQICSDSVHRCRLTLAHNITRHPSKSLCASWLCGTPMPGTVKRRSERVADSLVLRWFCRLVFQWRPHTAIRLCWAQTIQPEAWLALTSRVT